VEFSRLFVLDGFQPERYSPLALQRYSLKYRYIVQSYKGRTQSLVAEKTDILENKASRNFDLMINMMTFEHISSGLVLHQMASAKNNTSGPIPQCSKTFDCSRSSLVLHQMMSDHNSLDLAPQRQMASAKNNTSGPVTQCSKDV
ncbi:hypothetical protein Tco_1550346, partial [Tanacetum coccineum]